jgi:hypothetical protein
MTDDVKDPATDILEEFFAKKRIPDRSRPICEVDDWGVYRAGNSDLCLVRVPRAAPMRNPPRVLRLYVLVCQNCGFVRQHARRYVDGGVND